MKVSDLLSDVKKFDSFVKNFSSYANKSDIEKFMKSLPANEIVNSSKFKKEF
jgi:hypothetical protein